MLRTFNYTGRKRINQNEVTIQLDESNGVPEFNAEFRIDWNEFPDDAEICVEAYSGVTRQRFDFGTVERHPPTEYRRLDNLDLTEGIKFRVLIVDGSDQQALILAAGNGFLGDSNDELDRTSLLTVKTLPLEGTIWRLNCSEEFKPELILNNRIPNAIEKMRSDPVFQALILPIAMRDILRYYLLNEDVDREKEIVRQWLAFAEKFSDIDPDFDDNDSVTRWVDDVVGDFSKNFGLCDKLAESLKGIEQC